MEELEANLQDALELHLEVLLDKGWNIPEPREVEEYSGRIPKSVHQNLIVEAQQENISLNQYILFQ